VLAGTAANRLRPATTASPAPPPFTAGYDLVDRQGNRVPVKTLRATPTRPRTIIGEVRDPCDVVVAIRRDFDHAHTEALEIPRTVADQFVGKNGKVSWTHKLVAHQMWDASSGGDSAARRSRPLHRRARSVPVLAGRPYVDARH
jgi:hypothetical protein